MNDEPLFWERIKNNFFIRRIKKFFYDWLYAKIHIDFLTTFFFQKKCLFFSIFIFFLKYFVIMFYKIGYFSAKISKKNSKKSKTFSFLSTFYPFSKKNYSILHPFQWPKTSNIFTQCLLKYPYFSKKYLRKITKIKKVLHLITFFFKKMKIANPFSPSYPTLNHFKFSHNVYENTTFFHSNFSQKF